MEGCLNLHPLTTCQFYYGGNCKTGTGRRDVRHSATSEPVNGSTRVSSDRDDAIRNYLFLLRRKFLNCVYCRTVYLLKVFFKTFSYKLIVNAHFARPRVISVMINSDPHTATCNTFRVLYTVVTISQFIFTISHQNLKDIVVNSRFSSLRDYDLLKESGN